MSWWGWVFTGVCAILAVCLLVAPFMPAPDPLSEYESDRIECEQLRDLGWREYEIKEHMKNSGGLYIPPEE